jgi:hypothetical protein
MGGRFGKEQANNVQADTAQRMNFRVLALMM